jgi:hypothetical protein
MNGLIILDGPDHAGKTTLAKALCEMHGGHYMHMTYRMKNDQWTYHLAGIDRAIRKSKTQLVVLDRSWMSEICYAEAFRGGTKWPEMGRMLDRMVLGNAGLYVICLPEDLREHNMAFERHKEARDEMYGDNITPTLRFHVLWDKIKHWPHVMRYDYLKHPWSMPLYSISVALAELQKDVLDGCLVGGHLPSAKYLMITRKATRLYGGPWYPFVNYHDEGSRLIGNTLDKLCVEEHELLWADLECNSTTIKELLNKYDLIPICLGSDAGDDLVQLMGGYRKANNPQNTFHPDTHVHGSTFPQSKWFYSNLGSTMIRCRAYRED